MSDLGPIDFNAPKKLALARFSVRPVEMTFKSKQEGRPIFEDREFVEIIIPGDRRAMVSEPVNEEHKSRWPREYEAFKRGLEAPREGTPLRNWPNSAMTPARIEELAYFNIVTVEELAGVDDAKLQNLGMGARQMRQAAILFLDVSKNGTGPLERLVVENLSLKDLVAKQRQDIDALKAENQHLTERP